MSFEIVKGGDKKGNDYRLFDSSNDITIFGNVMGCGEEFRLTDQYGKKITSVPTESHMSDTMATVNAAMKTING